jgi:branched-chain amino acid transport system permease protein
MYYTVIVVFVAAWLFIYRIVYSPFGQVLKAIKENEPRAISLGYDADRYKLVAFILSAALAGLAGATKAIVFQLASLTDVDWPMSGEVVLMVLLGGMGTTFGPVVGAFILVGLESVLTSGVTIAGLTLGPEWVPVITGAIFVVCVLAFRRGVVGEVAAFFARRRR